MEGEGCTGEWTDECPRTNQLPEVTALVGLIVETTLISGPDQERLCGAAEMGWAALSSTGHWAY